MVELLLVPLKCSDAVLVTYCWITWYAVVRRTRSLTVAIVAGESRTVVIMKMWASSVVRWQYGLNIDIILTSTCIYNLYTQQHKLRTIYSTDDSRGKWVVNTYKWYFYFGVEYIYYRTCVRKRYMYKLTFIFTFNRKKEEIWLSSMTKAPTPTETSKYITIAAV